MQTGIMQPLRGCKFEFYHYPTGMDSLQESTTAKMHFFGLSVPKRSNIHASLEFSYIVERRVFRKVRKE